MTQCEILHRSNNRNQWKSNRFPYSVFDSLLGLLMQKVAAEVTVKSNLAFTCMKHDFINVQQTVLFRIKFNFGDLLAFKLCFTLPRTRNYLFRRATLRMGK